MFGIDGQAKGAAVCLHSAQVTRRDGTWVTVLLVSAESVCERVAQKVKKKTPFAPLERTKCVSSGYRETISNTQDRSGHVFNLASIWLLFSFYMVWQPRGAA